MPSDDETQETVVNRGENIDGTTSSPSGIIALSDISTRALLSSKNLCSRCSSFDILFNEDLRTRAIISTLGAFFLDFGHLATLSPLSTCHLCRFWENATKNINEPCQLLAVSADIAFTGLMLPQSFCRTIVLAVQDNAWSADWDRRFIGIVNLKQDRQPSQTFGTRSLDVSSFDLTMVESWIRYCKSNHTSVCHPETTADIFSLRVIDCETTTVIDAPINCQYITLSYVWGSPSSVHEGVGMDSTTLGAAPRVVVDSIEVVKKLGYRYLWVDRYCINQLDASEKHLQICQMDMIYSSAQLTIVAAAGDDANYGLPGVNGTRRNLQPSIRVGDHVLLSAPESPHASLSKSVWVTRGWTYQEGLLSKRRLIFTTEQVLFECNSMHCVEALHLPLDQMHDKNTKRFHALVPTGAFKTKAIGANPEKFMEYVHEFTKRNLTFETDGLNAIGAVFRVFEKCSQPVYQLMGVPLLPRFVIGLLWWHRSLVSRRKGFPSWSWAGWDGPAEPNLQFDKDLSLCNVAQVMVEMPDGSLEHIPGPLGRRRRPPEPEPELLSAFLMRAGTPRFIHLNAKVSTCRIIITPHVPYGHYYAILSGGYGFKIRLPFLADGTEQGGQGGMHSSLLEQNLTAIVLQHSLNDRNLSWNISVMVVVENPQGNFGERVGICRPAKEALSEHSGYLPNRYLEDSDMPNADLRTDFVNSLHPSHIFREWLQGLPTRTIRVG